MGNYVNGLPPQQLSFKKKNKAWRKKHLDWAESKAFFNCSLVRNSVTHKKINYDLINGVLNMKEVEILTNPECQKIGVSSNPIQHYPIMNSKLNVLRGEESKRVFDFKVTITNPNSISEIENNKKAELAQKIQSWITSKYPSEEESKQELERLGRYFNYEWQDIREVRANALLNHYMKEYNIPYLFNQGFSDALIVGEEIYQCDIISGEPTIEKLNPLKVRVFQSGYSSKVEDADMIVIEDYWNIGRVIDTYYDVLSPKDIKYLENGEVFESTDSMDNIDDRRGLVMKGMFDFYSGDIFGDDSTFENSPYDVAGNVRVLRVYWKSRRKIKKVKSYDPKTGEEDYNFYPEDYIIDKDKGEEEQIFFINEAWEGTKIGSDIYVNMRPRVIQYNRLSNPSRCHFGIIGSIYNLNESKPFSLVDVMKPYNYLYDVVHDRLNKLLAHNWGKIIQLDLSKVPKGWDIEKWMYYARTNNIAVIDSFREGNIGAATGKLAGALNNASSGVINAEVGNIIQQNIQLLEFIKMEMAEVGGISKQREGQVSNRETVGGVERATLQSSYITEWLYVTHDDVKKRVLEAFLETAKIAMKGRSKKFKHILSDFSSKLIEIEGDEFAESDYGLVVDNSPGTQELNSKLDTLAQAALQNQTLNFSTIMKVYGTTSMAEKVRMVEENEQQMQQTQQQTQQQQVQQAQQQLKAQSDLEEKKLQVQKEMNELTNKTKLDIAELQANTSQQIAYNNQSTPVDTYSQKDREALQEKIREFDAKIRMDNKKLDMQEKIAKMNANRKNNSNNK